MPAVVAISQDCGKSFQCWMAGSGSIRVHDPTSLTRMTSTSPSPKATRAAAASKPPASYEAALQELEQLVAQIDAGQLPLEQLLSRYQRGAELLAFCRQRLAAVENQIQQLEGGELKPWGGA
jgi:exodeoxyribonuclease VII small subunit